MGEGVENCHEEDAEAICESGASDVGKLSWELPWSADLTRFQALGITKQHVLEECRQPAAQCDLLRSEGNRTVRL